MAHTVEKLQGEPIIVVDIHNPYDYETEPPQMFEAIRQLAEDAGQGYVIYDCRDFDVTFGDLVAGMRAQTGGAPGSISDPNFLSIIVGSGDMLQLAANGFKQDQYGQIDVPLYPTLEDALQHARSGQAQPANVNPN